LAPPSHSLSSAAFSVVVQGAARLPLLLPPLLLLVPPLVPPLLELDALLVLPPEEEPDELATPELPLELLLEVDAAWQWPLSSQLWPAAQ
jgi:hypothetical protein